MSLGAASMTLGERLRWWGNIANLSTPLGLAVAKIGRASIERGPRGLYLGEHYRLRFPIAGAFTIGNVITTGSTWDVMVNRYPNLLRHEEGHTWQYLYCAGLPFYPLYAVSMAWSLLRTGDRAARNFFERQAGLALGGYQDQPIRPITVNVRALALQSQAWLRSRS
jgi:hypothetical protein